MSETVQSFERGLKVITCFTAENPAMTLAEVARASGLNRAVVRRLLHTLEDLGYARRKDDRFELTARVLDLGYAYLASFGVPELAMPYLEDLSQRLNEASSLGVLDGTDVVYVARIPAKRVMTVSIGLGSKFPAYRTSLGRALLSATPEAELERLWEESDHSNPAPGTVRTLTQLKAKLEEVRAQGFALVDQELEVGVRSIAAPVRDSGGRVIAAMNVSTHASRTPLSELRSKFVPALLETSAALSQALNGHTGLSASRP